MTIAACYVCPEGVVLGADSTGTFPNPSGSGGSYYNYVQKVFQIGEGASLGLVGWGLGALGPLSYRTLVARLADQLQSAAAASVQDAALQWSALLWREYSAALADQRQRAAELTHRQAELTPEERYELLRLLSDARVGFCVGGHAADRTPGAYSTEFDLRDQAPPAPVEIPLGRPQFWGWQNLIYRLTYGMDDEVFQAILESGKWSGSPQELANVISPHALAPPGVLPIREAIDWVYSSIYATIKGFKFSQLDPVCGGPIEVAVITTDRAFRWVTHKSLDIAIT